MGKLNEKLAEKKTELSKLTREYENSKLSFSSESKILVEKSNGLLKLISQHEHKVCPPVYFSGIHNSNYSTVME
jgi:hypothetical protein